jgi:hypothetical protein
MEAVTAILPDYLLALLDRESHPGTLVQPFALPQLRSILLLQSLKRRKILRSVGTSERAARSLRFTLDVDETIAFEELPDRHDQRELPRSIILPGQSQRCERH